MCRTDPRRLRSGREGEDVKRLLSSALLATALGLAIGIVALVVWEAACR